MFPKPVIVISLDEDQMPCDLQLRGYAHWKRPDRKDEAKSKDPYQILFTSISTTKLNEIDFWKDCWPQMTPTPRWKEDGTSGKTADLKHLDQACKNHPTSPVALFTKCSPPYQNGKLLFYFWPQYSGWKKEISSEDATEYNCSWCISACFMCLAKSVCTVIVWQLVQVMKHFPNSIALSLFVISD